MPDRRRRRDAPTLYLVTCDPGREDDVRRALESRPQVADSRVLFQGHVVVRVLPAGGAGGAGGATGPSPAAPAGDPTADAAADPLAGVDGVREAVAYPRDAAAGS